MINWNQGKLIRLRFSYYFNVHCERGIKQLCMCFKFLKTSYTRRVGFVLGTKPVLKL